MAHLIAARQMWLYRFGVAKDCPAELFPQNTVLADIIASLEDMHSAWSSYLHTLDQTELVREFEYRSKEGLWFRNTIEDILTQLFGHSWYHRGQIAAQLRLIGAVPAVTDFVFWAREPIPSKDQP